MVKIRSTMSVDEKERSDVATVVSCGPQQQEMSGASNKKSKKKCVVIAVASVVITALVLAAILIGMYLFTEAQTNLIKESMQLTPDTKQEMTVDAKNNVIEYRVENPEVDAMVVEDYNSFISVTKLTIGSRVVCFAKPFNESDEVDLTNIDKPNYVNMTNASTLYYVPAKKPIPDISFLSQKAQVLCKGIPIYWVYPMCADMSTDSNSRNRRGVCKWICNWVCRRWFSCHFDCFWADIACSVISFIWSLF